MDRRAYLALTGLTLTAALAGCTGDDDDTDDTDDDVDDTGDAGTEPTPEPTPEETDAADDVDDTDDEPEETPEETPEEEDTPGPSDYRIDADVPSELEVGEEFTYSWTVENVGDGPGQEPGLYGLDFSIEGEEGWEPIFEEQIELDAGEAETEETDPTSFDQRMTVQWEFWVVGDEGEHSENYETAVISPERSWGEAFETPTELDITASDPEFTSRYTYEGFGGDEETHQADDGMQFVFIELDVENVSDGTNESPNILSFELIAGGSQYETMSRLDYERDDVYDGLNDLAAGVSEDGILPFEIPDDVGTVELFYTDFDIDAGDWEVIWG